MIVLKKIRWKNFLSTGNVFTEIDLLRPGTTLIVGENGAGKSTLLDALSFALFNKPFRNVNKPQLMNTVTRRDLVVELDMEVNGVEYRIIRGMKPNLFEVYQKDRLLNQSADVRDYQQILEKQILKINHKSFCQVVILGTASFTPFMQLSTGRRREIIEDLLDLQIFTTMNSILKQKANDNASSMLENEHARKLVTEKMKLMKRHIQEARDSNSEALAEKRDQIADTNSNIDAAVVSASLIQAEIDDLMLQIEDLEKVSSKIKTLDGLRHKLKQKVDHLSGDIEFFKNHDDCPTCRQGIPSDFKEETIVTKEQKIVETQLGLERLEEEYTKAEERLSEISSIQSQIHARNLELSAINTRVIGWREYIEQLEKDLANLKKKREEISNQQVRELVQELDRLKDEHERLVKMRNTLTAAGVLLKDGGIKAKIIKQYVPIINKLINKYLSAMDFFINFELNENFEETIKSRYRDDFSYASFSEGEKMRINLAVLFTWRAVAKLRNSVNTNILILDEVMDSSLDSNGTDEFMKILTSIAGDSNIFIISHKVDQLVEKFDHVIRFEKVQNFSKMVA